MFPGIAGTWLDRQPPGQEKDAGIAPFAREVIPREPPTAVDWALTIRDSAVRAASLRSITASWRSRDPEAADSYLNGRPVENR